LQFRVLGFGLLQDGDVGVGVFPEGEEILIGGFRFGRVALQGVGAAKAETRQCTMRCIKYDATVLQNSLKLCGRFIAFV